MGSFYFNTLLWFAQPGQFLLALCQRIVFKSWIWWEQIAMISWLTNSHFRKRARFNDNFIYRIARKLLSQTSEWNQTSILNLSGQQAAAHAPFCLTTPAYKSMKLIYELKGLASGSYQSDADEETWMSPPAPTCPFVAGNPDMILPSLLLTGWLLSNPTSLKCANLRHRHIFFPSFVESKWRGNMESRLIKTKLLESQGSLQKGRTWGAYEAEKTRKTVYLPKDS